MTFYTYAEIEIINLMRQHRGYTTNDPNEPQRLLTEYMSLADRARDERQRAMLNLAAGALK